MATTALRGTPVQTSGALPAIGSKASDFKLVKQDLSTTSLADYTGKTVILNIFPSVDTATCATSVRKFNEKAGAIPNVAVVCVSKDLPFAQKRFCGAEGISNVITASDFRDGAFAKAYGLGILDGALQGLLARAVVIIDPAGAVKYVELVADIANEPDYDAALAAL